MQSTLDESNSEEAWQEIAPVLEAAMDSLNARDRNVVVLRFFEGKSLNEVGAALGGQSEDAARMRVNRALERLRKFFAKRGVSLTAAIIAGGISAHSVQAAPVALAKSVATVAVVKGATASASTLTLIKGALKLMAWTKAKMAVAVASALILTTGATVVIVQSTNPMRGKTESQWIKSIVYFGDENQTKLWRSFGPKGVHMLVRALRSPIYDRAAHLSVASLIDQLGDDAKSAIPDLIIQLKIENEEDVRSLELAYFEVPIQRLPESQKMALFPELLNAMQSQNANVRNNALVALQYYPSQAETVIPLMVKSLQDASPVVRLMAVKALHQVDPQNPAKSDFVPILVGCLTEEANESVIMLGMAAILSIVTCHDVFRRPPSVKKSSGAG
jgi:hypothetical protein